ncbi:winged helix-turn-helix transcriptional regulator [bacterium]|nr:winged helix-turn-helix transcriptional regulator [bacterium]
MIISAQLKRLSELFSALSDPIRFRIVRILDQNRELCIQDLSELFGLSQPTISRKLGELRRVGILQDQRVGKRVFYKWSPDFDKMEFRSVIISARYPEYIKDLGNLDKMNKKKRNVS